MSTEKAPHATGLLFETAKLRLQETEHNARLIAAAPDLYAALKALEGIIYCVDGLTKVEWREEAEAARAALAKAEGNS